MVKLKKGFFVVIALFFTQYLTAEITLREVVRDIILCNRKLSEKQKKMLNEMVRKNFFYNDSEHFTYEKFSSALCCFACDVPLVIPQKYLIQNCIICLNVESLKKKNLLCCGNIVCTRCLTILYAQHVANGGTYKNFLCCLCGNRIFKLYGKAAYDVRCRVLRSISKGELFKYELRKARRGMFIGEHDCFDDSEEDKSFIEYNRVVELFCGESKAYSCDVASGESGCQDWIDDRALSSLLCQEGHTALL